jgi:hypothetical protein
MRPALLPSSNNRKREGTGFSNVIEYIRGDAETDFVRRRRYMLEIDVPGFGIVKLEHLVADFTRTLSVDGRLIPKVDTRLNKLAEAMKIHILHG